MQTVPHNRRGISLLEVLISIGILSVGLASVLALLPAGGSQAKKAMVEDRRSALGAAAIGDVVSRGFLRSSQWNGSALPPVALDPLGANTTVLGGGARFPSGLVPVSVPTTPDDVFVGGDDLSIQTPEDESVASSQRLDSSGKRLSEGKFTWLATVVPFAAGPVTSSSYFRLSIVEFYQRPFDATPGESVRVLAAAFTGQSAAITASLTKDDFKKFFPKGAVILATNGSAFRWLRILMAAPTEDAAGTITLVDLELDQDVTSSGPLPFTPTQIYAYAGSVGVAEQIVRLEEDTPWTAP
jgi:type II secretory pathway pseudopilin PulG